MTIRSRRTLGTFFSAREVPQLPIAKLIRISSSYRKCGLEQEQIFGQAEAVPSYGFCSQHSETFLHIRVYPCSLDHGLLSNSLQICEENRRSQFPKAEQLPAQKHRQRFPFLSPYRVSALSVQRTAHMNTHLLQLNLSNDNSISACPKTCSSTSRGS